MKDLDSLTSEPQCLYIKASVKNILVCYFSHSKCLLQRNRICKCLPENPNCWMFTAKIPYKACMTVQFSPIHLICMANLGAGSTQILWLNFVEIYIFKSLKKIKCIFGGRLAIRKFRSTLSKQFSWGMKEK